MSKNRQFELDDSVWKHKIKKLAAKAKVDEKEFIKQQGGIYLRDIAKFTPPYAKFPSGKGSKVGTDDDLRAGIGSIRKDLSTNFRVRDQSYIEHIYDVTGKTQNVRQVLRNKQGKSYLVDIDFLNIGNYAEAMRFHRSRQSRITGRASHRRKGGKDTRIGRWKDRNVMWVNRSIYGRLHDELISEVGNAKAAIATASIMVDKKRRRDSPKWVKRHLGIGGNGKMQQIRGNWNAVFKASAPGLHHVARFDIINRIKRARLRAMEKRLNFLMKQNVRKQGLK